MDTVCREGGKAYRVEPEEELIVDRAGLVGNVFLVLVFPPDEDEREVCGNCGDDDEERILECRRRGGACDEVSYEAAARSRQKRQNIDSEDVHLFPDAGHGA